MLPRATENAVAGHMWPVIIPGFSGKPLVFSPPMGAYFRWAFIWCYSISVVQVKIGSWQGLIMI